MTINLFQHEFLLMHIGYIICVFASFFNVTNSFPWADYFESPRLNFYLNQGSLIIFYAIGSELFFTSLKKLQRTTPTPELYGMTFCIGAISVFLLYQYVFDRPIYETIALYIVVYILNVIGTREQHIVIYSKTPDGIFGAYLHKKIYGYNSVEYVANNQAVFDGFNNVFVNWIFTRQYAWIIGNDYTLEQVNYLRERVHKLFIFSDTIEEVYDKKYHRSVQKYDNRNTSLKVLEFLQKTNGEMLRDNMLRLIAKSMKTTEITDDVKKAVTFITEFWNICYDYADDFFSQFDEIVENNKLEEFSRICDSHLAKEKIKKKT